MSWLASQPPTPPVDIMSAPRFPQRRPAPPSFTPSSLPKPAAVSLEDWDAKTQLSERETRSIAELKSACERRRLPLKFEDESHTPQPGTPKNFRSMSPRPGTPYQAMPATTLHPLHPTQPISTPQQFHDWFSLIERSISHSQESHYRAHLAAINSHVSTCDYLLERVDEVDILVSGMLQDWRGVEEGGRSLQGACERLLEEKDRLMDVTEAIGVRLEYFQELEHSIRMLNHPGEALVLQTDFLLMVERVDVCIEYLQAHRQFKEADLYLLRFQQCMTRAMTLIKMYFVGTIKALGADVQKRINDKDVSHVTQTHLLYSKFRAISVQIAPLLAELERRAASHPEDLSSLLAECHTSYFTVRRAIVTTRLVEEIRALEPAKSDLVELTRSGCTYLKQVCTDEFSLYRQFFDSGEERLYRYLEGLCDHLYDDLRPRILHESRLTTLCQVCTVLQALVVLDSAEPSAQDDDEDSYFENGASSTSGTLKKLHISQLLKMVLQDAQTRLLFKAQSVVQSEIRYYAPTGFDLDYPKRLTAAQSKSTPLSPTSENRPSEDDSILDPSIHDFPLLRVRQTWFPTVEKTYWILTQLRDFVKPSIFEDIAGEAISASRHSLLSASDLMSTRTIKSPPSIPDSAHVQLFLIRHLLILKEIVNAFGFDTVKREEITSQKGIADSLGSLLRGTSSLFSPATLFGGFTGGHPGETMAEARVQIDSELKRVCENLIAQCSDTITASLKSSEGSSTKHEEFRAKLTSDLPLWMSCLRLYLEDDRTIAALLHPIESKVAETYDAFLDGQEVDSSGLMSGSELRSLLFESSVSKK